MYAHTPTGWRAEYGDESLPVEAFDADGDAMVVDRTRGCLQKARSVSGFSGLVRSAGRVVATLPAQPGYRIGVKTITKTLQVPIVAWAITDDREVLPVYFDPMYMMMRVTRARGEVHAPGTG